MRWKSRSVLVGAVAAAALAVGATGAQAAASTGWMVNNASRVFTLDGCKVVQSGYTNYGSAWENGPCSGNIGVAVIFRSGSTYYASSYYWAASSVRVNAPNVTHISVAH